MKKYCIRCNQSFDTVKAKLKFLLKTEDLVHNVKHTVRVTCNFLLS